MITASIVSHGHGEMVSRLVEQLLVFPEISQVIVTLNIPENLIFREDRRVIVIENLIPQGFGSNHNAAFMQNTSPFFCVLNPDVTFVDNPFGVLLSGLQRTAAVLAAPLVVDLEGHIQDSLRGFMTPWRMLKRVLKVSHGAYDVAPGAEPFYSEWVAGMFMLFDQESFARLHGFDTVYFMYCEDADICTRLWMMGGKVVAVPGAVAVHQAQRASHVNIRHLYWHLASMIRYVCRFVGRFPRVPNSVPLR